MAYSFNRPEKLNALLLRDWKEMGRIVNEVNEDEDVKALGVLRPEPYAI